MLMLLRFEGNKNTVYAAKSVIFAHCESFLTLKKSEYHGSTRKRLFKAFHSFLLQWQLLACPLYLFLLGVMGWFVINANKLGETFRENIEVQVFTRENTNAKDSAALVHYIASQPYTKSYEYITKDLAKKRYLARRK